MTKPNDESLKTPEFWKNYHAIFGTKEVDTSKTQKAIAPTKPDGSKKPETPARDESRSQFEIGRVYNRRDELHAVFGGQQQGGISTPQAAPFVMLFTGDSGEQYGYRDGWDADGVFLYTGEGQVGDMQFVRGNRAIRDHVGEGKVLELFESLGKGKGYRYVGQFSCSTWEYRRGKGLDGNDRQVIVFHLVLIDDAEVTDEPADGAVIPSIDELRRKAYLAAQPAVAEIESKAKRVIYERSKDVRNYVLARAGGKCESCKQAAPFVRTDGTAYLEPHHTRRVSDGGPDHPKFVGAICPNCHREIHCGSNGKSKNESLVLALAELEKGN